MLLALAGRGVGLHALLATPAAPDPPHSTGVASCKVSWMTLLFRIRSLGVVADREGLAFTCNRRCGSLLGSCQPELMWLKSPRSDGSVHMMGASISSSE